MKRPGKKTGRAVVLLSGGIDSSTTLAAARAEGYAVYAMTFDYRQRHRRELESARMVAESLGVVEHRMACFDLRDIGGSALTSDVEVPKRSGGSGEKGTPPARLQAPKIPVTYVPARNTIFLSFALAWAEVLGADRIFIGANAVDYSGYPDCRPEYLRSFEHMANLATRVSVEGGLRFRIMAPLLHLSKAEIIRMGNRLGLDYGLTWSCYDPVGPGVAGDLAPCGSCDSCLIRARGFREAGLTDPLLQQGV